MSDDEDLDVPNIDEISFDFDESEFEVLDDGREIKPLRADFIENDLNFFLNKLAEVIRHEDFDQVPGDIGYIIGMLEQDVHRILNDIYDGKYDYE